MPTTKLQNYIIHYTNLEEFHQLKNEIFIKHCYQFETEPQIIIDAGAHIGLATLYFKKMYPQAKVIAIEPHPQNFELLEKNIWENNLEGVEIYNLALSDHQGTTQLHQDTQYNWFSTTSINSGAWNGEQQTQPIEVRTQTLHFFLEKIKLPQIALKLDVEGSEQRILLHLGKSVRKIGQLLIEFHPTVDQKLTTIQKFLIDNGFQVNFWKNGKPVNFRKARGLCIIQAQRQ